MSQCEQCSASRQAGRNFCTGCGADLRPDRVIVTARRLRQPLPEARLRTCGACGAVNAVSRSLCARCEWPLDLSAVRPVGPPEGPVREPFGPEEPEVPGGTGTVARDRSGPVGALFAVTLIAGVLILGVLVTILSARGVGIFAGQAADEPEPPRLPVTDVEASSYLTPAGASDYGPHNLVDGDPTTAWQEGVTGDGQGEWVDLVLASPADVRRLLIWNGYQKDTHFADHNRVASLRIDLADRTFTVELLDQGGPQAVDLPEAVRTSRVRLTIVGIYPGLRYNDTALSQVELYGEAE